MDSLFAVQGDGFVIMAADANVARSILVYQSTKDKIRTLDDSKLLACGGPQADCSIFGEYIEKNMTLYELNNGLQLSTKAAANYIRRELATALRKGPFQTQLLLGGIDAGETSLYWLDYLGTMIQVPFGAHGYGSNFTLGIFDRHYKKGLSQEEGMELINKCIAELQVRFLIAQPKFVIKVITKDGVKVIE